jgi:hypothetical protein
LREPIVFLAEGKVVECGSPAELVQIDGLFKKLVAETGKKNAEVLTRLALKHKFEMEQDLKKRSRMFADDRVLLKFPRKWRKPRPKEMLFKCIN